MNNERKDHHHNNQNGFYISRIKATVLTIVICLIIIAVGLLAIFFTKHAINDGDNNNEEKEIWLKPFLNRGLLPRNYELNIFPDFYKDGGNSFTGFEIIDVDVFSSLETIVIHIDNLTISSCKIRQEKKELEIVKSFYYEPNNYWVIRLKEKLVKYGGGIKIYLNFSGHFNENNFIGMYKSSYVDSKTGERRWLVTTKFQPTYSRKAFPCFDEPRFKATFQLSLKHHRNFTAISNMPIKITKMLDVNWKQTEFQSTPVMSTYLVCFAITDFPYKSGTLTNGKQLRIFSQPNLINQLDLAMNMTKRMFEFLEKEFQMNYHLPKLDQIAVPDYSSGATEHWGLISYKENYLSYDFEKHSTKGQFYVAGIIAHELSHNYFGNPVTCEWWDDVWLNEGFARFYQVKTSQWTNPTWEAESIFLLKKAILMSIDTGILRPILINVESPDSINSVFDIVTYDKGGAIIQMLENVIGKNLFRTSIRNFLNERQFSTMNTEQFIYSLQKTVGNRLNVNAYLTNWLKKDGYPLVTVRQLKNNNNTSIWEFTQTKYTVVKSSSSSSSSHPLNNVTWHIMISYITNDDKTGIIWMNGSKSVTVKLNTANTKWIKFNNEESGYYRVLYEQEIWQEFQNQFLTHHTKLSASNRHGILDDLFALVSTGHLRYETALNSLKYLHKERNYLVWKTVIDKLTKISVLLKASKLCWLKWNGFLRNITNGILNELSMDDRGSRLEKLLRVEIISTSCTAGSRICRENITLIFDDWLKDENKHISANLKQSVYVFGMAYSNSASKWSKVYERSLNATPSSSAADEYIFSLISIGNASILFPYLERLLESKEIHPKLFSAIFKTILKLIDHPIGIREIWNWLMENYQRFLQIYGISNRYFANLVPRIAQWFTSEEGLRKVTDFYKKYPDAGPSVNNRKISIDKIKSNINWIKNYEQEIANWLNKNRY